MHIKAVYISCQQGVKNTLPKFAIPPKFCHPSQFSFSIWKPSSVLNVRLRFY